MSPSVFTYPRRPDIPAELADSAVLREPGGEGVYLTFDDGPSTYTPHVLNILQDYAAPASFFVVGQQVKEFPGICPRTAELGLSVQNHTWSHPDLRQLTSEEMRLEITRVNDLLQQLLGTAPTYVREPYGFTNQDVQQVVEELGLRQVLWSIDTRDWDVPKSADRITQVALTANGGDIILMHDGGGDRSATVAALPVIIEGLRARGFELRDVTQLPEAVGMRWLLCEVTRAGPAKDGHFYIALTDTAGAFADRWFYAFNPAKREMLLIALAALTSGNRVIAALESTDEYSEIRRLYIRKQ